MNGWGRSKAIGFVATIPWVPLDYLRFSDFSEPGIDGKLVGGIENPKAFCRNPKNDRRIAG